MTRLTPHGRALLAANFRKRALPDSGLSDVQRAELLRHSDNLLAVNSIIAKRDRRAIDTKTHVAESHKPRPLVFLRNELTHYQLVYLADVLEGWALAGTLPPEKTTRLAQWACEIRDIAIEAGEGWKPLQPTQDPHSILVRLGRTRRE